ncbi:hypothetical protein SAMN04487898_11842 [Pedobacter sp. ok626]|uniref:hypothetical protein n=1 Tax=Pedobacter sp. ok626 TaxID=1761882 RepID=UPI000882AA4F|nr:hypothetical protein [Pedobacter sp. ok626]SDL39532.1 hypothetical protein SAMN04487898_11842 [Pedobacter sp. ok626]
MKKELLAAWMFMLIVGNTYAQEQPSNTQQSPGDHAKYYYLPQLSIQTDRVVYLAGETIWLQLLPTMAVTTESQDLSKLIYVEILDAQNKPVFQEKIGMKNGSATGYLKLPTELSTGNYTICAYTNWMKNFGEDCFFKKQIVLINSFQPLPLISEAPSPISTIAIVQAQTYTAGLSVKTAKTVFHKREKVTLNLKSNDSISNNLMVTVIKTDKLSEWAANTMLTPDLQKNMSKGKLMDTNPAAYLFPPEINGQLIKGKVLSKAGDPLPNIPVLVTIPGKNVRLYAIESDQDGNLDLEIPVLNGNMDLIVQPLPKDSTARIVIHSPYHEHKVADSVMPNEVRLNPDLIADIRERHKALQVQLAYHNDSLSTILNAPPLDSTQFFGKPDEKFNLDDYNRFTTIEEVFREYVGTIMVQKHKDGLHLHVLDKGLVTPRFSDYDPFIMLDGVPIFNFNKFFKFDPFKLKKGAVIAHTYFYNNLQVDGILSLQTYNGDLDGFPLEPYVSVHSFNGIQLPRTPFSPQQAINKRLPDQRSLIYYAPNVLPGTLDFYTSDVTGNYRISVQNLNKENPMNTTLEIKVE